MNDDSRLPIAPMDEAESTETRDLLKIERRLKSARPVPVDMDGYELARLAGATPMRGGREPGVSRRRRRHVWALVATSWICGATIGALGMFAVMHDHESNDNSVTTVQGGHQVATPQIAREQSVASPPRPDAPLKRTVDWNKPDTSVLANLASLRALSLGRRSVLCVGMVTPAFTRKAPEYLASLEDSFSEFHRSEADFDGSPQRNLDLTTDSDFTRALLMQEILAETGAPVL